MTAPGTYVWRRAVRDPAAAAPPAPSATGRVRLIRTLRLLGAALSGLALAVAFPPWGLVPLGPLGVAGLTAACRGRRARTGALLGAVTGLVFFAVLLYWLRVFGDGPWAILAVAETAFLALLGAGLALVAGRRWWPLWSACLWVAEEALRDRLPLGGFPWGRLAGMTAGTPFQGLAALGGFPLVSFAVALAAGLALAGLLAAVARRPLRAAGALLGGLAVSLAGLAVPLPTGGQSAGGPSSTVVAAVQGLVPRTGLDALGQRHAVTANLALQTARMVARADAGLTPVPQLVLWPENATDIDPADDAQVRAEIVGSQRLTGVPMLVGEVLDGPTPTTAYNAGVVWTAAGPGAWYVKRHPVPFGEYIPFRSLLAGRISALSLIPRDMLPGHRPGVLQVGPARIGDLMCYDLAFDPLARAAVTGGGRMIVVQTNNASYGRTGQTRQQLALARLRAIEHGRSVVVAATSGISAVIAPDGRIRASTGEFVPATLVRRVALRDATTVADRVGAAPEYLLAALGALVALAGFRPRRVVGAARTRRLRWRR